MFRNFCDIILRIMPSVSPQVFSSTSITQSGMDVSLRDMISKYVTYGVPIPDVGGEYYGDDTPDVNPFGFDLEDSPKVRQDYINAVNNAQALQNEQTSQNASAMSPQNAQLAEKDRVNVASERASEASERASDITAPLE
ncbi:hypothetical protein [Capybara microvirus Cap3_SP_586]|nr:hypothetical protein [Capybara microvirus Cap3_SP_586]